MSFIHRHPPIRFSFTIIDNYRVCYVVNFTSPIMVYDYILSSCTNQYYHHLRKHEDAQRTQMDVCLVRA